MSVEELTMPATVRVPVAVTLATERLPETRAFPCTERAWDGEVVPTPTLERKYAFRVVVDPPRTMRPLVCVPPPIVVEAKAVRPPLN